MSRRRPHRIPPTRRRTLWVLAPIPDDAPEHVKNGLAIRNACNVAGVCPVCGATGELTRDAEYVGVFHLTFRHDDGCPVLRDDEAVV